MNAPAASLPDAAALAARDGLPFPQRYWAILAIAVGISLAVLDGAVANVALPSIARMLHASPAASIWIVNAYQLAVTISLLPLAAAGELIGYRRIYLGGLLLFTLASLACACADSLGTLTLARVAQGFGAAGIMSVNSALLRQIYPKRSLGHGISINASVIAIASAIAPTVASAVLAVANWPWLFAINVPIGVVACGIGMRALPRNALRSGRFDYPSALLNAATFGLLFITIDSFGHSAPGLLVGGGAVATLLIGIVFVRRQLTQAVPLLPIDLLKIPAFALAIAASVVTFIGQMLAIVSLPFFLQNTLGRTQVETGLLMTPWPAGVALVAPFAGYLVNRVPAGALGAMGLAMLSAGLVLLATVPPHPDALAFIWRMALCGIGYGLFQTPNNRTILTSAPLQRSGGASGMLGTARLSGQTMGATLVALFFGRWLTHGVLLSLYTAACCTAIAAVLCVIRVSATPRRTLQEKL
ncbi:MAG: MFS transporter [Janthinobacterium lividum]